MRRRGGIAAAGRAGKKSGLRSRAPNGNVNKREGGETDTRGNGVAWAANLVAAVDAMHHSRHL